MSVRVAVRVRPFNQREKDREPQCCVKMVRIINIIINIRMDQKLLL